MKREIKRTILLAAVFVLLFGAWTMAPAYASEDGEKQRPIRVAFPQSEGLSETTEDGTRSGVFYDWLVEIAKYTGWEYEFVGGSPEELLEAMESGELDLMCGMFYMPSLEEYYAYPHYSIGTSTSLLIKRSSDADIQSFDLSTINGKTIGVFENATNKIEQLRSFLSYNSITCELEYFADPDEMGTALDDGRIDLLMGGDPYVTGDRIVVTRLGGEPYYIVTPRGLTEIYEQLNKAITDIYTADPNFAAEVHALYFPEFYNTNILLTEEDNEFIKNAPPVKVILPVDRYPLSYIRKDEHKGICQDVFGLISERTGLRFEFVYGQDYQEAMDMIAAGEADVIGAFMDDEAAAQEKGMILTKSYLGMDEMILKNKKSDYPSGDFSLAVVEGRVKPNGIEPKEIYYYPTFPDCVDAIEKGEVDVSFIPSAFVEDLFYRNYYAQVAPVGFNSTKSQISIAIPKPANVQLFSIINKAINSIPADEIEAAVTRNLMTMGESKITLKSIIYSNPLTFIAVASVFFVMIIMVILIINKARMKNKLMQAKLEQAEETSRVKSEFLSQMSHEIKTPMNAIIGLTQMALLSKDVPPPLENQLEEIQSSSQFLLSLVNDVLDMAKIENSKMKLDTAQFRPRILMEQAANMMRSEVEKKNIRLECNYDLQDECYEGDEFRIKQVVINLLSNAIKFTNPDGKITLTLSELQKDDAKAELFFSVEDNGIGIEKQNLERIFRSFEQAPGSNKAIQGTGLGLTISSNLVRMMGGELSVESAPGKGSKFFFSVWLPFGKPREDITDASQKQECNLKGLRVLLAEDNDLNAKIVTFMLEKEGVEVERAVDGQEAADMFRENPQNHYDLVLMDIQMPIKSGLAATEDIRKMEREDSKTIPIIAMTANTFKEDQDKAIASGMNSFIPKPFKIEQLYEIIDDCLSDKGMKTLEGD